MKRNIINRWRPAVLICLGFAMLSNVTAQHIVPSVEWELLYEGSACDFHCVTQTDDGGYILGGTIYETRSERDCVLVKIGSQGEIQWEKAYGGSRNEVLRSLRQTTDGGYVFVATSSSPPSELWVEHAWVVKVSADGNKQWEQTFGGTDGGSAASIWQTMDGGYVLAGGSLGPFGGGDGWLIKMDAQGNEQWERFFGGESAESLISARQTTDKGFVLAGYSYSAPSGNKEASHFGSSDGWLIKVDAEGNKQWERSYGGTEFDSFYSLDQAEDGGFVLGGESSSPPSGNKQSASLGARDYWIVKVHAGGDKEWDRSYNPEAVFAPPNVRRTADQGYIFNGRSLLIKIDSQGYEQWFRSFGSVGGTLNPHTVGEIKDLQYSDDGGYMVVGFARPDGEGSSGPGCKEVPWAAKLENLVARAGDVVMWEAEAGVVLESTDDLKGEWASDESEVLSVGAANSIPLEASGGQRYYRLRATGTPTAPSLSFGSLLSWPVAANQRLEFAPSKEGGWEEYPGDQGIVGENHYAIIPPDLREHYYRTRGTP